MTGQNDLDDLWVEHRVLRQDFYTHEAVVEERWKTVFNELRDFQSATKNAHAELKERVDALYKLMLTIGGSLILVLVGALVSGVTV